MVEDVLKLYPKANTGVQSCPFIVSDSTKFLPWTLTYKIEIT